MRQVLFFKCLRSHFIVDYGISGFKYNILLLRILVYIITLADPWARKVQAYIGDGAGSG